MANRAQYDAGAAALDYFAKFMMNRQAKKEARAEQMEDENRYEQALLKRELAQEERAKRRVTGNSGVYRGVGAGPDGPSQDVPLVDLTNAAGEVVSRRGASQKETTDYDTNQQAMAARTKFDQEEFDRKQEDRMLDRKDKDTRTQIAARNAAASELRASRTGMQEPDKPEKPLTRNEALKALSSFRYRAQEGESARDVADRDGVDYDSILEAANRGAKEKEPGMIERGLNAVGGALKNAFTQKKAPPVLGSPGKKEEKPKYPDGTRLQKGGKVYVVKNGIPVLEE